MEISRTSPATVFAIRVANRSNGGDYRAADVSYEGGTAGRKGRLFLLPVINLS